MDRWQLEQFKNIVDSFLAGCSQEVRDVFEQKLDFLSEHGNQCGMPLTENIEKGLFALRGKDKDSNTQIRLMFIFRPNRTICFVHAFFKKTRKISDRDKKISRRNKNLIEQERGVTYGINLIH